MGPEPGVLGLLQLPTQHLPSAVQVDLHTAQGPSRDLGDFIVLQTFDLAQHHDAAVALRQLREGVLQTALEIVRLGVLLGTGGVVGHGVVGDVVDPLIESGSATAMAAQGVVTGVAGHLEQPGEHRRTFQLAAMVPQADQNVLGDVLRVLGMAQSVIGEVVDPVPVRRHPLLVDLDAHQSDNVRAREKVTSTLLRVK